MHPLHSVHSTGRPEHPRRRQIVSWLYVVVGVRFTSPLTLSYWSAGFILGKQRAYKSRPYTIVPLHHRAPTPSCPYTIVPLHHRAPTTIVHSVGY